MNVLNWIGSRASERSTWLGLVTIAVSVGLHISPQLQETIVNLGIGLAGVIVAVTSDKGSSNKPTVVIQSDKV